MFHTLKQLNTEIVAAGCVKPRMERSYKRRDHREVLIFSSLKWPAEGIKGKKLQEAKCAETLAGIVKHLTDKGYEVTHQSWSYYQPTWIEVVLQVKVAPSDMFSSD